MIRAIFTAATLAATIANQAQASVLKDKWIDSVLECIFYSSKMNCDRAEGAAELYARSLRKNPDATTCALSAKVSGVFASTASFTGQVDELQRIFEGSMTDCENF